MNFFKQKVSIMVTLLSILASTTFVSAEAYWSRTAEVRDGVPLPAAVQHALGFVKISAANGLELNVTLPIAGNPNRIRWSTSGKDIATVQANFRRMQQIQEFQEHWMKGLEMYMHPSHFGLYFEDIEAYDHCGASVKQKSDAWNSSQRRQRTR